MTDARRFWTYPKNTCTGPLIATGGDEYGNRTLCLRLPQGRALVAVYSFPLNRDLLPSEGFVSYGWVSDNPDDGAPWDNPLPGDPHGTPMPAGWTLVSRETWHTPWEAVTND